MSDNNNTSGLSVADEMYSYCLSDLLSEEGLHELIERHQFTSNDNNPNVGDYQFFHAACYNRRVTEGIIRCLLEYFPDAIRAIDENDGQLPLHVVCQNPNVTLNIVQLLIDADPSSSVRRVDNNGWMPLHHLCMNRIVDEVIALGILMLLVERHPGAIQHATNKGSLPIHLASQNKHVTLKIVQLLIDAAPDSVRSVDEDGDTPLHNLCRNNELDETAALGILELLIDKHPEAVRHADNDGNFPIHCIRRSPEFCRVLIEAYPGSERIANSRGVMPLHRSCGFNTVATIKYLYKIYPDAINHASTTGGYPIHAAIICVTKRNSPMDTVDIVKFLLGCDPNVKLQKLRGEFLLYWACRLDYNDSNIEAGIEVIKAIYDAHPEAIEHNRFASTIQRCHQQVQAFINDELVYSRQAKDRHVMTTPDGNGRLPLHTALQNNVRLGSIKLLVKGNPCAIRNVDTNFAMPLHVACQHHNSASVVQYLIGLDISTLGAVDREGNTALHLACRSAKFEKIAMLLDTYDVSVSKRNSHGKLPIDLLWESNVVLDREGIEYTESVFRLLNAYPEMVMVMNIDMQQQQSAAASCPSYNGKKRKFSNEE
eukprot:scaffold37457_cov155-Skeletonema_dohrnii-CCMP3373.AAC.2